MSQTVATARLTPGTPRTSGVCAVVPARGGSKGVPRKNLRPLAGEPLIARSVRSLLAVASIDTVWVSTEDAEIAEVATSAGAQVVDRPDALAGDLASSESALEHALQSMSAAGVAPEITVFVQATSPFIDPSDVERAIAMVRDDECDVAFSVTRSDVHLWRIGPDGADGVNHDSRVRQRRQDRSPEFAETGAFYVMRTSGFLEHGHRFFGRLQPVEVAAADALEIDTVHDLHLAAALISARDSGPDTETSSVPARAVVTDFDGVHTDDHVMVDQHGTESVRVSRSDGMGVALLRRAGIPFLILSTETNDVVRARAAKLGVDVIAGCEDKATALTEWATARGVPLSDITYLGNDVNDVGCLERVGWPVAVADAHPEALRASHHVLRRPGGDGAVRELAELVLAGIPARPGSTTRRGLGQRDLTTERHAHE